MKNKTQLSLVPKTTTLSNVFDALNEEIWKNFDVFASPFSNGSFFRGFYPEKFWNESEQDFKTEVEIPRFAKEDIKLSVEGNMLHINAEKDDKYRFYHSINIPEAADIDKSDVKLEHGVLTISFPKKESAKAKVIEIK